MSFTHVTSLIRGLAVAHMVLIIMKTKSAENGGDTLMMVSQVVKLYGLLIT